MSRGSTGQLGDWPNTLSGLAHSLDMGTGWVLSASRVQAGSRTVPLLSACYPFTKQGPQPSGPLQQPVPRALPGRLSVFTVYHLKDVQEQQQTDPARARVSDSCEYPVLYLAQEDAQPRQNSTGTFPCLRFLPALGCTWGTGQSPGSLQPYTASLPNHGAPLCPARLQGPALLQHDVPGSLPERRSGS